MALIGEIQKRIWIVFVLIMIALVGFLFMDMQGPGGSSMGSSGPGSTEFASIDGKVIAQEAYNNEVLGAQRDYLVQQQKVLEANTGEFRFDDATIFNLKERAWTSLVNDQLMNERMEKSGITLNSDEFGQLIYGDVAHPYIQGMRQAFPQLGLQNGPGATQEFVQLVSNQENYQQFPILQQYFWDFLMREKAVKRDAAQQKYVDVMQKSTYTPQWLAARDHQQQNTRLNFDYVSLSYRDVADDEVPVTEAEVEARFLSKKSTFQQQEASRNVEYVVFEVLPTSGDTQKILDRVIELTENWKTNSDDSSFLSLYSVDQLGYTSFWYSQKDLYNIMVDSANARGVFAMDQGSYSAPYFEGGYYKVAKNMDRDRMVDSTEARHIFIRHDDADEAYSQNRTDSIYGLLTSGSSTFEELAAEYSDDDQNKTAGGTLGWIVPNTPLFASLWNYAMKDGQLNDATVIRSVAGFHIIELTDRKTITDYRKVTWLAQRVRPSKETDDRIYDQSEDFYSNFGRSDFDAGVSELGLQKRISGQFRNDRFEISSLPNSRSIIDWAFNDLSEQGEVKSFNLPDKYVVVKLKERNEKGAPQLAQVRTQIESELINEKKAAVLLARFKGISGSDLASIA
ncbi:MAG: peptidyl-prolyl cis-trans isomerase D, partial [Limisphaerales bacterium]